MKQRYSSIILFIIVIIYISGAIYLKWEKSQQQEVLQPSPLGYVEPVGSYINPISSLSGDTYQLGDEESGISLELPVEFKQTFSNSSLRSHQVFFEGKGQNLVDKDTNSIQDTVYTYSINFDIVEKTQIASDKNNYSYEDVVFPKIKNLAVGKSYTYSRFSNEKKREIFGENYEKDMFTGDQVYTRLPDVGLWKVYKIYYYESEPSYGYISTIESETHFYNISYSTSYFGANLESESNRSEKIKVHLNTYLSILESAEFN